MKNENLDNQIKNLQSQFCPYGWLDLKFCINVANEIGETEDWVFEKVGEFKDSCDIKDYSDIDPCFVVYDSILKIARNELKELTGVDIINDFKNPLDNIVANYLDTGFNINEEGKKELNELIKKHKIKLEDLSLTAKFFINEINNF